MKIDSIKISPRIFNYTPSVLSLVALCTALKQFYPSPRLQLLSMLGGLPDQPFFSAKLTSHCAWLGTAICILCRISNSKLCKTCLRSRWRKVAGYFRFQWHQRIHIIFPLIDGDAWRTVAGRLHWFAQKMTLKEMSSRLVKAINKMLPKLQLTRKLLTSGS